MGDGFSCISKRIGTEETGYLCGGSECGVCGDRFEKSKNQSENAGFTDEERAKFGEVLKAGFIDTFRYFYPEMEGIYSWWSYRFSARAKNAGWRIDYFCVSESLKDRLADAKILTDVMGSDHCPIELDLK